MQMNETETKKTHKRAMQSFSKPSAIEIENAIFKRNAQDPFRYNDIKYGFEIVNIERFELTLDVTYSFYYDPAEKGEASRALFHYNEDYASGFFSECIPKVTIQERFTWTTERDLLALDLNNCIEHEEWVNDQKDYYWDDPDFPTDLFHWAIVEQAWADSDAIAFTLVNDFGARDRMPDLIPRALQPYFQKLVNEFED